MTAPILYGRNIYLFIIVDNYSSVQINSLPVRADALQEAMGLWYLLSGN